ncbi:hypothetical protein DM02DRAFT_614544 [Periconia macrospinosa]|uniref:Uncharacterized protein n=1 Tax=Periconia macrospinosa TaxID=97972 RepID=A0A2V1DQ17_9PLEO|nr:hypothetical protein DM02DRAFT_614544 [Periconia macrospinosa]
MPEITFVFGPHNSFFFDSPKIWKYHNLPQTLRQLFNSSMSPSWRIAQPYYIALAPQHNTPEPIWYTGCKVLDGEDKIFYSHNVFDQHYPELSGWTKSIPNAPRSCFVTFGTDHSYFASAPGRGSIWAGIPSELSDKIQKAYDTPCCVALGSNSAWFVLWPDGYCSWKFYGNYSDLDQILASAQPRSVSYLALSPYNKQHYFVAFRDRTIQYNFKGAPREWMQQMQEVFSTWQSELAQSQAYLTQPGAPAPNQSLHVPHSPHQWNRNIPHSPSVASYMTPPTPRTPVSINSNLASPLASPYQAAVNAHHEPLRAPVVEMLGDVPARSRITKQPPPVAPIHTPSSENKKRKSIFKFF